MALTRKLGSNYVCAHLIFQSRALNHKLADGTEIVLDGLLVPSDVGQTTQIAAQAGMYLLPSNLDGYVT
jgi:hypothetical protein